MSFELVWTPKSLERLRGLDRQTIKRIVDKTEIAKSLPRHYFEKLVGLDSWRLRVGDYRVIVLLDEANKKIVVQTIGHRKNIYK